MVNHWRLMIQCFKTIGKNIIPGQPSRIVPARQKTRLNGVIAKTMNEGRNAASGRSYLSSNGLNLPYIDYYFFVIDNG